MHIFFPMRYKINIHSYSFPSSSLIIPISSFQISFLLFFKKNVFLNHRKNSCRGSSKIISFALTRGLTSDNTPFVRFIFDKKCLKFNDSHNSGKPISRRYGEKLFDFLTSFSQFLTSSQRSF